jgi:hypothetical protein
LPLVLAVLMRTKPYSWEPIHHERTSDQVTALKAALTHLQEALKRKGNQDFVLELGKNYLVYSRSGILDAIK